MKKVFYWAALPLFLTACSADNEPDNGNNDLVQVNFNANLPQVLTRADVNASDLPFYANKLTCAIFNVDDGTTGDELVALRNQTSDFTTSGYTFSPRLVKGMTYRAVFVAQKDDNYNLSNLTAYSPTAYTGNPIDYECFTAVLEFTAESTSNFNITLARPMARLNLAMTQDDWNAFSSLGYTLTNITVSYTDGVKSYNLVNNTINNDKIDYNMTANIPTTPESFANSGTNYKKLASYMVFTDGSVKDINYIIKGKKGDGAEEVLATRTIHNVPLTINHNTNVLGDFVTGQYSFSVTVNKAYESYDNNNITSH